MIEVPLVHSDRVAIIDDEDRALVEGHTWYLTTKKTRTNRLFYAASRINGKIIELHRLIVTGAERVDHIDHDGLNNRRSNLRACTHQQNLFNSRHSHNKTGYRGVRKTANGRFAAQIGFNMRVIPLGTFDTAEEAAQHRDNAAIVFHGEFAHLNYPKGYVTASVPAA